MAHVDKAHVARVIAAATAGSVYGKNAARREEKLAARVAELSAALTATTHSDMARLESEMDAYASRADEDRSFGHVYVHCDMDAFFAAVEARDNPSLRGVPFAVGGMSMISTASYEARAYGVRSAMPGFIGKALCPSLVLVRPRFSAYEAAGEEARAVFRRFDPDLSSHSLDEASLDLTRYLLQSGCVRPALTGHGVLQPWSAEESAAVAAVVQRMRSDVATATRGLTVSAGIGPTRTLAKMASDVNKPNGQLFIPFERDAVLSFVGPKPVRRLPGVGRVTEALLVGLGFSCCSDLLARKGALLGALKARVARWLVRNALGVDSDVAYFASSAAPEADGGGIGRKSVSHERTFSTSCHEWTRLIDVLLNLSHDVASALRHETLVARTVTLKVKLATFEVLQRGVTLRQPTDNAVSIADTAISLLRAVWPVKVRLLGVRASNLELAAPPPTALDSFLRRRVARTFDDCDVQIEVDEDEIIRISDEDDDGADCNAAVATKPWDGSRAAVTEAITAAAIACNHVDDNITHHAVNDSALDTLCSSLSDVVRSDVADVQDKATPVPGIAANLTPALSGMQCEARTSVSTSRRVDDGQKTDVVRVTERVRMNAQRGDKFIAPAVDVATMLRRAAVMRDAVLRNAQPTDDRSDHGGSASDNCVAVIDLLESSQPPSLRPGNDSSECASQAFVDSGDLESIANDNSSTGGPQGALIVDTARDGATPPIENDGSAAVHCIDLVSSASQPCASPLSVNIGLESRDSTCNAKKPRYSGSPCETY